MTAKLKVYVVNAYRWGLRDCHSYVVGAKMSRDDAVALADAHVEYRGGKYGCEVVECAGETVKCVYYHECPYFGAAGHGNTAQPVDSNKAGWVYDQATDARKARIANGLGEVKK